MKNGGPAFPTEAQYFGSTKYGTPITMAAQSGMTLRDYFAGQALAWLPHVGCGADLDSRDTAAAAYQIADAMLKEREK